MRNAVRTFGILQIRYRGVTYMYLSVRGSCAAMNRNGHARSETYLWGKVSNDRACARSVSVPGGTGIGVLHRAPLAL